MKIALLLIGHLLFALVYLYFDATIKSDRQEWNGLPIENWFSLGYFVPEAFFTGSFILICSGNEKTWLETQFCWVEGIFIYLRGIIYALSDSEIYDVNGRQRIFFICAYLLIATLVVTINAKKHGFFRND